MRNHIITIDKEIIIIKKTENVVSHNMLLKLKQKNESGLILFSSGTTDEPKAALHDMDIFKVIHFYCGIILLNSVLDFSLKQIFYNL